MDRRRYDSAMFWLAFGTAAAVIGLALMTIGVSRSPQGASLLASPWFDAGLSLLAVGVVLLLLALVLFLSRRRDAAPTGDSPGGASSSDVAQTTMTEAIRGYYAERKKLFDIWDREKKDRPRKRKA